MTLMTLWCAAVASAETIRIMSLEPPAAARELGGERLDAAPVDRLLVDGVAAVGGDRDDDLVRPVARLVGVGDRQR